MAIVLIPVLMVDRYWPQIRDGMQEVCRKSGGQYSQDVLQGLCRRGEAYLVVDLTDEDEVVAAIVCQNQQWTDRNVLFLHACWGNPYRPDSFVGFAKQNFTFDCIAFQGRAGWRKTPGVRVIRTLYEMDV